MSTAREPDKQHTAVRIEIAPRTIGLIVLVIAGAWIAFKLSTVLIVITVALVMVGTLDPVVGWLERRGIRRGRALALVFLVITLVLAAVMLLTIPPLVSQLLHLIEDAPKSRDRLVELLRPYKWAKPIVQSVKAVPVNDLVLKAGSTLYGYSSDILSIVGYGITTLFLSIYLLIDPAKSQGLLYAVIPRHHHVKLARILLELKVIVGGYMRGQLITSVSMGVFVFALLTAFQVDDALAIALFAALTDIIPFVGGYVASAPCIAAVSGLGSGVMIIMTVIMVLYQEFESRILVPRVYGRVLRLPSAIVLVALLIGGTLMGILGALLALPIAAGVRMIVRELRVELPGEAPSTESAITIARDEKVEHIFERLTEGATAQEASVIAGKLAQQLKDNERAGATPSAEMPIAKPPPDDDDGS